MQEEKFISLKDVINKSEILNDRDAEFLLDNEDYRPELEKIQNLYQITGIKGTGKASIRIVGIADKRPTIIIKEFNFINYNCKLVSHLLNDCDINESIKSKLFKMISLLLYKDAKIIGVLTMEFKTYDVIGNKNDIISDTKNIELSGIFEVYFRKNQNEQKIKLHSFDVFPGNNNIIEKLIKLLIHKELFIIYTN